MTVTKRLVVALLTAILSAGVLVSVASPALACDTSGGTTDDTVDYGEDCDTGGTDGAGDGDGDGDGSGPTKPTCDLSKSPYTEFCEGKVACWGNNPAANEEDTPGLGAGKKPGDEYHLAYKACADGTDKWYWTKDDEGPSLPDLARQAVGSLKFPAYQLVFNPPTRTYVNLPTWWWADGATTDELIGTSAGAVRAIATPDRMEVDPGDGSGVMTCPFVVEKSDNCSYTYRRASVKGAATAPDGSTAYPARMRLTYDLVIENGGTPITVAGIPDTFSSPWQDVAVPVREVQTVVRPRR